MDLPHHAWLEHAPVPTGVLRKGRYVYGNQALLELLGVSLDAFVGMSFTDPIAPEDRERVARRHERRLSGQRVPDQYQFRVVGAGGVVRTVLVSVASAGEDVVFQLLDLTGTMARQERIRAVAKLGAAIQAQRTEEGIFVAVAEALSALALGVARLRVGASGVEVLQMALGAPGLVGAFEDACGRKLEGWRGHPIEPLARAMADGSHFLDDPVAHVEAFFGDALAGAAARRLVAARSLPRAIFLRIDVRGVPNQILAVFGEWLEPEDAATFALLGAQISAALDAALVIDDLSSRNAELSSINHVAVAAGTGADLRDLFARVASEIRSVMRSAAVAIYVIDAERGEAVLSHQAGGSEEVGRLLARVPLEGTNLGVVAREAASRVWQKTDYDEARQRLLEKMGQSTVASVPLRAQSQVVGVMNVAFEETTTLSQREIEVLEAMAAHLAAALETKRLVSDLRRSYADLSRAQQQLVERERLAALGELAAAVAHEVRNPLGVIFNSLGSLQKLMPEEPRGRMLLRILGEEADRLNHIVGDLLDFARPARPSLRPGPLGAVVEEAVEAVVSRAPHVRVERRLEASGVTVPMDPRLLRQALLNVVENAVQAMPSGGTITVSLRREARGGVPGVWLDVSDTGAGIGREELPHIFEPFFTTRATGTGLGLAVVKRIVESHHGALDVRSEPARGATFSMWLPEAEPAP